MHNQIGTRIGDYTLARFLGSGGMGEVWLAYRDGIEKPFVLKLLLPQHSRNPEYRRRLLREAKLVASLPPGRIIPVLDYGEASDRVFLVMAFVDGVDLQSFYDALAARGVRLPYYVIIFILAEILEALRDAHTKIEEGVLRPIIHRDLKPSNILISSRGGVFLMDFGIALPQTGFSLDTFGTLGYIAPEQVRNNQYPKPQCDIWGVGTICHFLLTGEPPRRIRGFEEFTEEVLCSPPPAIGLDDVPQVLVTLHDSALEPREEARPASAGDLLALIDASGEYRRATTPLTEFYQRFIGGMHSGMTELLAKARAEAKRPRPATITMKGPAPWEQPQVTPDRREGQAEGPEEPQGHGAAEEQAQAQDQPGEPVAEERGPHDGPAPGDAAREHEGEAPKPEPENERWEPWWGEEEDEDQDQDASVEGVTLKFERKLNEHPPRERLELKGVPEEYIPRPPGKADEDAPKVRRRPRGTPMPPESDASQSMPPPFGARSEDSERKKHDGGGR